MTTRDAPTAGTPSARAASVLELLAGHRKPISVRDLVRRLAELIDREQAVIKERQPKSWVNRSGYHLYDVLHDDAEREFDYTSGAEEALGRSAGALKRAA